MKSSAERRAKEIQPSSVEGQLLYIFMQQVSVWGENIV